MEENLQARALISWRASAERPARSIDWFWSVGGVTFLGTIGAIYYQNWLFAVLILVAGASLALANSTEEKPDTCSITERGVVVNSQFFPYNNLTSFWIEEGLSTDALVLETNGALIPHVWVAVPKEMRLRVRELLLRKVPEVEYQRSLAEALGERLGL